MSSRTFPILGAQVMRGTLLDACGRPDYGDRTQIASEGFVSIAVTANYDDGTERKVTNANGVDCVYVPAKAKFLNYSIDIVFCAVDPEFYTLATGQPPIIDPVSGDTIGYMTDRAVSPSDRSWALEAWSSAQGSVACEPGDEGVPYGYGGWPFLTGARVGDYTLEDNAVTFTASQAITKDGTGWGIGPYLVARDAQGDPSPLIDALTSTIHDFRFYTTVAPPEATGGLIPLDNPDNADATGATAGVPGTFTPAGAVRPYDLAALTAAGITASPTSAWTTGQRIILGDGTTAHWSSSAWVAGPA